MRPRRLIAGIGPSISQAAFEVGEEVVAAFQVAGFPLKHLLTHNPHTGKAHIDLWEANRWLLTEAGLSPDHIELAHICTHKPYGFFLRPSLGQ